MAKTLLIDGHSILNRAYYGIPLLSNSKGVFTNAVYGFLNIMLSVMDDEVPDNLAVAFDVNSKTFRHEMYSEYKAGRHAMPEELVAQVPVIKEVLSAMNIPVIEKEGYEADDVLGTLAKTYEGRGDSVCILSGDRDMLQLASDTTKIRIPKTKAGKTEVEDYFAGDVLEKYGVTPSEFIDMKALMGDSSDNVPGVPSIGEKTASKIISQWHSIEEAYRHVDEIKPKKASENLSEYYDQAVFSKVLVTIKTDCELDFDTETARIKELMNDESYMLLKELELRSIISRMGSPEEKGAGGYGEAVIVRGKEKLLALKDMVSAGDTLGMYYAKDVDFEGLALAGVSSDKLLSGGIIDKEKAEDISDRSLFIAVGDDIEAAFLRETAEYMVRESKETWFIDLKSQLSCLELNEKDRAYDASIAAYLLDPIANNFAVESLSAKYTSKESLSFEEVLKKNSLAQLYESNRELLFKYLSTQACTALFASEKLSEGLMESGMDRLFFDMEMPLVYVLHRMESIGIRLKREELESYGRELAVNIDELEQDIYDLAGEIFNINSPKQLGIILFEKMNLPYGKKTKTGYSTAADVLEKLRGKDPIIEKIQDYRMLSKLKSTYADGLVDYIRDDGRIHCSLNQTVTATGRLSCTDPNLQNIPVRQEQGRLIRRAFVPEEGKVFINADYSQIELRVLAHMAGDEELINAYKEDKDIHRITASKVFHVAPEDVTPLQRSSAKAVNFGIVYGISSFGLSNDLGISQKEAKEYIEKYFETYPGIKSFLDNVVEEAKEKGYSLTLYDRRRPIPELKSSNFMQRSFGERVAMNSPIQGTAADIIKIAMLKVYRRMQEEGLKSKLILQIHDELLIEAVPEEEEKVLDILKEEMEAAAELKVPLVVNMNSGHNWYDLK